MKKLKAMTLWSKDQPEVTLVPGHNVTVKEFNEAHNAEGFNGGRVYRSQLSLEYWRKTKKGWIKSDKGDKKAKPFTVLDW